jgi:hypothetical protein
MRSSVFVRSVVQGCATAALLSSLATPAWAQPPVSDADREAARSLYKEGFDLQTAGDYGGALDRFKRSAQVYQAPTTLLHIAECEARLLHLVEAAEAYRALGRVQLAPGANPAFLAAQQQGAAELQQVEPRIPHVRIQVTPANVPNLVVFIDEQPMNMALLGVDRPINPGEHKFTAQAPGFARTETMVRIDEKQPTRLVSLALNAGAPGMLAPVPYAAPYPAQPQVVYVQPGGAPYPAQGGYQAPVYPPGGAPPTAWTNARPVAIVPEPEGPPPSRNGIFFGPRLGGVYGAGNDIDTGGFSLGAEFDFRFARRLYIGAVVDHGFLSGGASTNFDATFGVIINPDKFSALFQFAAGYRNVSLPPPTVGCFDLCVSPTLDGPEAGLGVGFWIPAGSHFRLAPRIDTSFGSLGGSGFAAFTFVVGAYPNFNF